MSAVPQLVLSDPAVKRDPYLVYARLRAHAPVHRARYNFKGAELWLVTRYDDVAQLLRDPRIVNNRLNATDEPASVKYKVLRALFAPLIDHMLGTDDPDHARLRSLVQKAFTPARIQMLRNRVERLCDELLTGAAQKGSFDVVSEFAFPVPSTIIAEMLGVPASDRRRFNRWSNALVSASATRWLGMFANVPRFAAFLRYIRKLAQQRRRDPQDDLISALVAAEEAGDKLNEDELVSMILLLLIAGYETTANLIASGTLALIENPEQMALLRSRPELIAPAVEEFTRYYTPIDYSNTRFARTDLQIAGVPIKKGEGIIAALSCANRDERQFSNPEALDITREPNRHLGFGHGAHYCLGAFLARLESQIAFPALLRHCPNLRLAVERDRLQWRSSVLLRGLQALPVRV